MKIIFLSLILLLVNNLLFAQTDTIKTNSWESYFNTYNKLNENYNYVYYYNTKGGVKIKSYTYFKCNNEFVLTYKNFNDSSFNFLKFKNDTLFDYLEKNFHILKKFSHIKKILQKIQTRKF